MSFGTYASVGANSTSDLTANGTLSLTCTLGDVVTISADAGANGGKYTGTTRAMSATVNSVVHYLGYELYTDALHTLVWNTTNTVAYTGTGTSGTATFYGDVPKEQTPPAATYTDTVNVTATF